MTLPDLAEIADPLDRGDPDRIADLASLRALLACDRMELGGGRDLIPVAGGWIEPRSRQPMQTGQARLRQLIRHGAEGAHAIDASAALALILDRIARDHGTSGEALARRVRASRQRIAELAAHRLSVPDAAPDYLTAEQALIFVAVTASESMGRLQTWASGRCLSASQSGVYRQTNGPSKTRRRVNREPSNN